MTLVAIACKKNATVMAIHMAVRPIHVTKLNKTNGGICTHKCYINNFLIENVKTSAIYREAMWHFKSYAVAAM